MSTKILFYILKYFLLQTVTDKVLFNWPDLPGTMVLSTNKWETKFEKWMWWTADKKVIKEQQIKLGNNDLQEMLMTVF